jgi:hypothetical protein
MSETDSVKSSRKRTFVETNQPDVGNDEDRKVAALDFPNLKRHCNNYEKTSDAERSEFLVKAMQKLNELQQLLGQYDSENEESDSETEEEREATEEFLGHGAEALGFAVCAQETFTFLHRHGLTGNNEVVQQLRARLIGEQCGGVGGSCP